MVNVGKLHPRVGVCQSVRIVASFGRFLRSVLRRLYVWAEAL